MYVGSSNSDELNIKNTVFDSNTATNGGAIYTLSTELVIEGSTLMNNVANFLLATYIFPASIIGDLKNQHKGSGGGVHAIKSPITFGMNSQAVSNHALMTVMYDRRVDGGLECNGDIYSLSFDINQ